MCGGMKTNVLSLFKFQPGPLNMLFTGKKRKKKSARCLFLLIAVAAVCSLCKRSCRLFPVGLAYFPISLSLPGALIPGCSGALCGLASGSSLTSYWHQFMPSAKFILIYAGLRSRLVSTDQPRVVFIARQTGSWLFFFPFFFFFGLRNETLCERR